MAARKKNTTPDGGPHSAAHTATPPPPAPSPTPPADGPAAAVWAALTATPGATAAQIAAAAGTSRIVAGQELAALETSGLATRTPGTRTGRATAPATWQPVPQPASPALTAVPADSAGEADPAGTADVPTATSGRADEDAGLPARSPGPGPDQDGGSPPEEAAAGSTADSAPGADETAPAPAQGGNTAPGAGTAEGGGADGPAAGDDTSAAPAAGEPQPTPGSEAAVLLRELATAAAQAADVLDGGDTAAALTAADALCATAAQARRLVKAAATGRKPRGTGSPASRPGQLRDLVAAHLTAHPDGDYSPHQIGRVLGRSSGAVANALDRLTALGQAQLTSEKPRRYTHQAPASTPAPAPPDHTSTCQARSRRCPWPGSSLPPARPGRTSTMPAPHHPPSHRDGTAKTARLTVSIWHNVTRDPEGRHTGFGGFTPGDQMVKVFTYDTPAGGRSPADIAEDAFAAFNDAPRSDEAAALARQYRQRRPAVAVDRRHGRRRRDRPHRRSAGFVPLRGTFTPVRVHEHGTHPIE